jgi:hypothetical protein
MQMIRSHQIAIMAVAVALIFSTGCAWSSWGPYYSTNPQDSMGNMVEETTGKAIPPVSEVDP